MHERKRTRAQLAQHLQLSTGSLPVSDHTQELEQEHAVPRVGRVLPHLTLELGQGIMEPTFAKAVLGRHGGAVRARRTPAARAKLRAAGTA